MLEQRQLLEGMLAHAEDCVKEIQPRIEQMMSGGQVNVVALEKVIFETMMRLGACWLGLVLSQYAAGLAEAAGTRRPCECGGLMRWVSVRTKTVLSLLGKVTYGRVYYYCKQCKCGEAIGDGDWGLKHTRTTSGIVQLVGYMSAHLSFAETARQICRTLCWPEKWLSGKQVQRLAEPLGETLRKKDEEMLGQWWEAVIAARSGKAIVPSLAPVMELLSTTIERLYVLMDGTMVRIRGLAGKGSDFKREVKVGAVFVAETGRRASHLVEFIRDAAKHEGREMLSWIDRPQGPITYVAGRVQAAEFGLAVYAEAVRRGLERAKEVVILGDGAHWIWEIAEEHFPNAVQILDFWHASEWVWKVARAAFGEGSGKAKIWAEEKIGGYLIRGDAEGLVSAIMALPPVPPPPGQNRSIPEQGAEYFRNNAERMRYPEYRARGMEIGSGAIESAGKRVVGQRCKWAGTRWTEYGLQAILTLRTDVLNSRYDSAVSSLRKVA